MAPAPSDRYGHLILAALRNEPVAVPAGINPDHLLWRLCEHGLAGLLHEVQRTSAAPPLAELASPVKAVAIAQEASVRSSIRVAAELGAAFQARAVPAVFVKGVALALTAYGRYGLRAFGDLDLLVHPGSLPAARAALAAAGFAPEPDDLPSSMEASWFRETPDGLPVMVDLHWNFIENDSLQAAVRVPVQDILDRRRFVESVPVPTLEDDLLLAAANLVRSRIDRMILIVDFQKLAAAGPDWDRVLDRASAWRLRTALWLGLRLSEQMFGPSAPKTLLDAIAPASWRSRWIEGVLSGSALWSRRKVRHRVVAYGLPFLCMDSWGDVATTLGAGRGRALSKLGFALPRRG